MYKKTVESARHYTKWKNGIQEATCPTLHATLLVRTNLLLEASIVSCDLY